MKKSLWYKNAIFYELYVRAFADGNGDGQGDFFGAIKKLDYLKELGVNCVWLLPMYPSPLLDDGYDIADHYHIHPDYGNLDIFQRFIDEAHQRGMKVIADLVLNHTSDQHPWFQSARKDKNSPFRDYYVWSDSDSKYDGTRIIFLDTESSNWTWDEEAGQFFWHRFYSSQPDLNFDNPAVQQEMINILKFWLDKGLDGFRMDAVPYLFEREGTNCENLPETHAYLKRVREYVDQNYPDRILLAEANQWPNDLLPYLRNGDVHMAFHFPLMPRIFMSLKKEEITPILDALDATPEIPDECQWCTFLRNHDELTLEMVTEDERQWMWEQYAPEPRMRLNLGIRRRLAPLLDNNLEKIALANSLLFSIPGSPIVYYGDEIGMGDNIWLKDRDGVRTPMQWNDQKNAGFSSSSPEKLYAGVIENNVYGYKEVNVQAMKADKKSLWYKIRTMIFLRKEYAIFAGNAYAIHDTGNKSILGLLRFCQNEMLLTLHNLSGKSQITQMNLPKNFGSDIVDLITNRHFHFNHEEPQSISLQPYEYRWLYHKT